MRTQPWLIALPMSYVLVGAVDRHRSALRPVRQLGLERADADGEHPVGAVRAPAGLSFWLMKKKPVGVLRPGLPTATGYVSTSAPRR